MKKYLGDILRGIWKENPVLVLLLGTCPTLALTTSASNGVGMGAATTFVLTGSNFVISIIAGIVPKKIRIPVYIVVIATFVTVVDLLMQAYAPPALHEALGIFIPLIVVNCIILGRAEAFACKNTPLASIFDGIGIGLGFTLALTLLGMVRELLGSGSLFGETILPESCNVLLFVLPPGAFISLGFLTALNRRLSDK